MSTAKSEQLLAEIKDIPAQDLNDFILSVIKGMSVRNLNGLIKEIEGEFGVTAAMPTGVAAAGGTTEGAAAAQTEFDVMLVSAGSSKIAVIKAVREATGLGLKEAKALVDSAPAPIKEKVSKEDAEKLKAPLEKAGATIEIK